MENTTENAKPAGMDGSGYDRAEQPRAAPVHSGPLPALARQSHHRVVRVPMRQLLKDVHSVLAELQDGVQVQVTSHGKVVMVATAPDPSEEKLDELVATGHVSADWRDGQANLRRTLRSLPVRSAPPVPGAGSAGIIADREDSDR